MELTVNPLACPQNHRCPLINVCPVNAIEQSGYGLPKINKEKCTACGKCTKYCPTRAFVIKK